MNVTPEQLFYGLAIVMIALIALAIVLFVFRVLVGLFQDMRRAIAHLFH